MLAFVSASAAASVARPLHPTYRAHQRASRPARKGFPWPWRRRAKTENDR